MGYCIIHLWGSNAMHFGYFSFKKLANDLVMMKWNFI